MLFDYLRYYDRFRHKKLYRVSHSEIGVAEIGRDWPGLAGVGRGLPGEALPWEVRPALRTSRRSVSDCP